MDHSRILELAPPELAAYFRKLLKDHADAEESLTASLFAAIERESLPPSVISVWLSIARSPSGLLQALTQEFSVSIGQFAIKRFFKLLRRKQWLETWDGVGGTPALLALLKDFSVLEVNMCLVQFSRWQTAHDRTEKQAKVTELLQGLLPYLYPDAPSQTLDERPFMGKYQLLLPRCSLVFVDGILRNGGPLLSDTFQNKANSDLLREHYETLRQQCLDGLFGSAEHAIDINTYLVPLLHRAPELPSNKSNFSESMAFSLVVLERFVSLPDVKPPFIVLEELIKPLIKRIQRRRVGFAGLKKAMDLSMNYLSSHRDEAKHLTFTPVCPQRFMYAYIRFWAASISHGLDRESQLVSLFRMYPARQNRNLTDYSSALRMVPYPQRYSLLKLLFAHIGDSPIDIDDTESLKKSLTKGWPCSMFLDLSRQQAIKLLMRLRKVSVRDNFLTQGSGILSHPVSQDISSANSTILLNLLEEDKPEVLDRATSAVGEAKIKSAKSREQSDRAFHAISALFMAISSGSLELYGETLVWARRFVKDPLAMKSIFARSSSNTIQGLRLLSGVPSNLDGITTSRIALNIQTSNRIIFQAFETVVSAMKEPSFYKMDWMGFLDLVADVITERLNRHRGRRIPLATGSSAKPGRLHHSFVSSTILLEKEIFFGADFVAAFTPLLRFFHPCYPGGLTPYISSRAEKLVFAGEEALISIPEDEELRSAVGTFVDRFRIALQIYVYQGSDVTRQARTMKAWNHALENLSGRMTQEEAIRTWKAKFLPVIPSFKPPSLQLPELKINRLWPLYPFGAECGEYTGWNPADAFETPPTIMSRQILPLTYLDLTLAHYSPYLNPQPNAKFVTSNLQTQGFTPPTTHIWDLTRLTRKERTIPAVREGLIVSALLYLGLGRKSVLMKPFPSPNDARYPAMWLDLSFVETKGIGSLTDHGGLRIIKSFLSTVPPTILYELTESSLNALFESSGESDANVAGLEKKAYDLLYLLAQSDRPCLATKFILKAVIERPDSSSWHRKLLSIRFMRNLSAKQASDLIRSFADTIQQKMKEAARFPKEESRSVVGGEQRFPRPYVKITTVKYLVQLLHGSDFVPESFALEILASLFTASTHIDIRVPIVQSLMDMLYGYRDQSSDALGGKILKALEPTIPIASRLDERYEVSEANWKDVKVTGNLPFVFEQGTMHYDRCIPPILETLIKRTSPRWQEKLLKQILVHILEASIATNTRWLELFTAKHNLEFYSLKLPLLPAKPKFLKELLRNNIKYLPAQIMDLYHSFILTSISPSPQLSALNTMLHDPAFSQLPEVKHWLSLYYHGPDICRYDEFDTTKLIRQKWPYPSSRITVSQLQKHVFEQAELLVSAGNILAFEHFMRAFVPPSSIDSDTVHSWGWLHDAQPVLERIIAFIESLRTLDWQQNPNRMPDVLPKVLTYKLYLLPYPPFDASATEFSAFTKAVREFVRVSCGPGKLYHEELLQIQVATKRVGREYRAQVACLLRELAEEMTVVDLLCVDLAKPMFMSAYLPQDSPAVKDSIKIVRAWVRCSNEDIRRKGVEVARSENFKKVRGLWD